MSGNRIVVILATAAFLAVVCFVNLGVWLAEPSSRPQPSDLIVALGGDDGHRIKKVVSLIHSNSAPRVLITGLEGAPVHEQENYLNWRSQILTAAGISADVVLFDKNAKNSHEEAINTLELMRKHCWERVIVVSDPPHMRRLNWIWHQVFYGSGKSFILVASEPIWWNPDQWWTNERSGQFILTEVIKLGYYLAKY